jgi:arylsulfatase A-like enzyme
VVLPPYWPDIPVVRSDLARHYANIAVMDAQVGALLDALDAEGLAEDTIVIWTTDHGDGLPRAKRDLYDSGLRVPMIVRWPARWLPQGLHPGTVDARLVSFVDLAPTIFAMAGVTAPRNLQGQDLLSPRTVPHRYVFAARDRMDEVVDRQRAVRDARYKYIRSWHPQLPAGHPLAFRDNIAMVRAMRELWRQGRLSPEQARWFEPVGAEQLYDLENDPFELHNLVDDAALQPELARLRSALDDWLSRNDDVDEQDEAVRVAALLCDGRQCITPDPVIGIAAGRATIRSPEAGASLGYRLDGGPWRVYSAPVDVGHAQRIDAKAVRYGWKESAEISQTLPEPAAAGSSG